MKLNTDTGPTDYKKVLAGLLFGILFLLILVRQDAAVQERWMEKVRCILTTIPLVWSFPFLLSDTALWRRSPAALWMGVCLAGGAIVGFYLDSMIPVLVGALAYMGIAKLSSDAAALVRRLDLSQPLDSEKQQ